MYRPSSIWAILSYAIVCSLVGALIVLFIALDARLGLIFITGVIVGTVFVVSTLWIYGYIDAETGEEETSTTRDPWSDWEDQDEGAGWGSTASTSTSREDEAQDPEEMTQEPRSQRDASSGGSGNDPDR